MPNAPRVKRQPLNKCLPRNCKLLVRRSPHLSNYAIKHKKRPHYILTRSHEIIFGLFSLLENEGGRRLVGAKREGELSFYPRLAQS